MLEANNIPQSQDTHSNNTIINELKSVIVKILWGVGGQYDSKEYWLSWSCSLVEVKRENEQDRRMIVDFGMHQGRGSIDINWEIPFEPQDIDLVAITHAHIDHIWRLPMILRWESPFNGKTIMHETTRELARIMLLDCAKLMFQNYQKTINVTQEEKIRLLKKIKKYQQLLNIKQDLKKEENPFLYDTDHKNLFWADIGQIKPQNFTPKKFTKKWRKKTEKWAAVKWKEETFSQKKHREMEEAERLDIIAETQNLIEIKIWESNILKTQLYDKINLIIDYLWEIKDKINFTIIKIQNKISDIKEWNKQIKNTQKIVIKLEKAQEHYSNLYYDIVELQDYFISKQSEYNLLEINQIYKRIENIVTYLKQTKINYNHIEKINIQLINIIDFFEIVKYDFCPIDLLNDEIEKLETQLKRKNIKDSFSVKNLTSQKKHTARKKLLYYKEDVMEILDRKHTFRPSNQSDIVYNQYYEVAPWIRIKLIESGHIVWSSQIVIEIKKSQDSDEVVKLAFSWDLWRFQNKHIKELTPQILDEWVNFYMIESTYWERNHPPKENEIIRFIKAVNEIADNKGKIIIPCFMLQRLQDIALTIFDLQDVGYQWVKINPNIPIYWNGSNIPRINDIYAKNLSIYRKLIDHGRLILSKKKWFLADEFMMIRRRPAIMLSPSWMLTWWPIMKYLSELRYPDNALFFVWYQWVNTIGKMILEWVTPIYVPWIWSISINARVETFKSFSSHWDQWDLLNMAENLKFEKNWKLCINHWESEWGQVHLAKTLKRRGKLRFDIDVITPWIDNEIKIF